MLDVRFNSFDWCLSEWWML